MAETARLTSEEEQSIVKTQEELEEIETLKDEIEPICENYEQIRQNNEELEEKLQQLQLKGSDSKLFIRDIENELNSKIADLTELQEQLRDAQMVLKEKEDLQDEMEKHKHGILSLTKENESLKEKCQKLEAMLEEQKNKSSLIEESNRMLLQQLDELVSSSQEESQERKDAQDICDQQYNELLAILSRNCPELEGKGKEEIIETIKSYSESYCLMESLNVDLKEKDEKLNHLDNNIRQLQNECDKYRKDFANSEKTTKSLERKIEIYKEKLSDLVRRESEEKAKYQINDPEGIQKAHEEKINALLESNKQLKTTIDHLSKQNMIWSTRYAEVEAQCYSNWNAYKQAIDKLEESKKEATKLRQMLTQTAIRSPTFDFDQYPGVAGSSISSLIDIKEGLPPPPPAKPPTPPAWVQQNRGHQQQFNYSQPIDYSEQPRFSQNHIDYNQQQQPMYNQQMDQKTDYTEYNSQSDNYTGTY